MSMSDSLFFIPILGSALQQPEPVPALKRAFAEIERMGREPAYRTGWDQFRQFMDAAVHAQLRRASLEQELRFLMVTLAAGCFEGDANAHRAALKLIRSRPEWAAEYDQLRTELEPTEHRPAVELQLMRDSQPVGSLTIERLPGSAIVGNLRPGAYSLALATGRVIWEGQLGEEDLIWRGVFGDRPIPFAADTGDDAAATRVVQLLDGALTLRVFPGPEEGVLEITAMES
jgi:hypothetical protein